jgi:DNA end-binding protein Ku
VENDEVVKGHEREDGEFVLVEEDEVSALRPESTKVVDISDVVAASVVDPVLVERAYFLAPENKAAGASFAVLRDALDTQAAVGRLALHGREYLVAVTKRDDALMLYTLRTAGEVRKASAVSELKFADLKSKPQELKLARQVLGSFETGADIESFTDNYQKALRDMLKRKKTTTVETDGPKAHEPRKVVNLMDALRKSLEAASSKRSRPAAKATRAKKLSRAKTSQTPRKRAS